MKTRVVYSWSTGEYLLPKLHPKFAMRNLRKGNPIPNALFNPPPMTEKGVVEPAKCLRGHEYPTLDAV